MPLTLRGAKNAPPAQAAITYPLLDMPQEDNGFSHPTREEIAICAYLIWEKEGRPAGRTIEDWLQAETQLMACRAHDGWTREPAEKTPDGAAPALPA